MCLMLHASQLQRYIEMIKIKIFIVPTKLKLLIFIPLFISIGIIKFIPVVGLFRPKAVNIHLFAQYEFLFYHFKEPYSKLHSFIPWLIVFILHIVLAYFVACIIMAIIKYSKDRNIMKQST